MKMCGLFIIWSLFIFGPVVRSPLGSFGDLSLIAILVYLSWSVLVGRPLSRSLIPFFFLAFFLSALAILNSILVSSAIDSSSLQAILRPIKGLLVLSGLFFAVKVFLITHIDKFGSKKAYEVLLFVVYAVIVFHGMIIILQFFYPSFRDLTYLVLKDFKVLAYNKQFRMPGLAGAGGAQVSAVQGLGFFIGVHLVIVKKKYFPFVVGNILLVVSLVLTGRTGFVLVGISGIYVFFTAFLKLRKGLHCLRGRLSGRTVLITIVLIIMIFGLVPFLSFVYEKNEFYRIAMNRTFETYLTYQTTGHLSDRTIYALSKMFIFPSDVWIFILGNARLYNNTTGAYASDLGYIRLLWGYGLIGLIGHVCFFLLMGFYILKPRVRQVMGIQNIIFAVFFLASIFILNIKEVFFFTRMIYPITIIVVMGLFWLSTDILPLKSKLHSIK